MAAADSTFISTPRSAGSGETPRGTAGPTENGPAESDGGADPGPSPAGVPSGNLGGSPAGAEWPGGRVRGHGLPIGRPPGCLQRRTDDPAMRPAAAQIAVQSLPHLLLSRGATVAQQANRGHHHAGGAIAALGGLLIDEGLLDRMGPAAARQPHHGDDRAVHGRHRQVTGRAGAVADEH
jgi:hypothetical protein